MSLADGWHYDRQFRREALARKCLDWSVPNQCLYTEAFTGRGIPRCSVCLQDDHRAQRCPHNLDYQWTSLLPGSFPGAIPFSQGQGGHASPQPSRRANKLCRRFNDGLCRLPTCRYIHSCRECGGSHPALHCNRNRQ